MNPYGNNHTASWFPAANIHTSTPINEASFPFMDPMMDNQEFFCSTCTLRKSDRNHKWQCEQHPLWYG